MTSSVALDLGGSAASLIENQQAAQQARDQQKENAARTAVFAYEHVVTGAGQTTTQSPVRFDVDFLEAPRVTSGVVLDKLPDLDLWLYPVVTAGVARWQTKPNPADARRPFYVGAYLFFVVRVDPIYTQRTDGSDVAYWQKKVDHAKDSAEAIAAAQKLKEAKFAQRLKHELPAVVVRNHVRFEGNALKLSSALAEKAYVDVTTNQMRSS